VTCNVEVAEVATAKNTPRSSMAEKCGLATPTSAGRRT
jgi:hypothetical protein